MQCCHQSVRVLSPPLREYSKDHTHSCRFRWTSASFDNKFLTNSSLLKISSSGGARELLNNVEIRRNRSGSFRPVLRVRSSYSEFRGMEPARIKVVGIGGGGNNAVNRMIASGLQGKSFDQSYQEKVKSYTEEELFKLL